MFNYVFSFSNLNQSFERHIKKNFTNVLNIETLKRDNKMYTVTEIKYV